MEAQRHLTCDPVGDDDVALSHHGNCLKRDLRVDLVKSEP